MFKLGIEAETSSNGLKIRVQTSKLTNCSQGSVKMPGVRKGLN